MSSITDCTIFKAFSFLIPFSARVGSNRLSVFTEPDASSITVFISIAMSFPEVSMVSATFSDATDISSSLEKVDISVLSVSIESILDTTEVVIDAIFTISLNVKEVDVDVAVFSIMLSIDSVLVRSNGEDESTIASANPSNATDELPPPAAEPTIFNILDTCAAAARLFGFFTFK